MPRWRFWEKSEEAPAADAARPRIATIGRPPPRTPASPGPARAPSLDGEARERKRAQLLRRRESLLYDVEQGELALRPENPWQDRIALLDEAIAAVEAERAALAAEPPAPTFPVPPIPITDVAATAGEPAAVSFAIDGEAFRFEEEIDWDQRGGPRVRGELRQQSGDAARLVPPETPPDRRDALAAHFAASVAVFATDLRDRAVEGTSLPDAPTRADLAQTCPECGGWKDWRGHCAACTERAWRRQALDAEVERLATEQATAAEERRRQAERLPIARRRLADLDAELAAVGG